MRMTYRIIVGVVVLLTAILVVTIKQEQAPRTAPQQAAFFPIKCTVAKFLLADVDTTQQIAPLFENLGNHHFAITTEVPRAQEFFNQGLRLTYAFNHAEAHRAFMEAARLDPDAPMAYWGQAYALGPNINDALPDDERKKSAFKALTKALKHVGQAGEKEKALINALASRYSEDTATDLQELNIAYMEAMAKITKEFPEDGDIQTLYAASVMNTMPWNYWDNDGNPQPNTLKGKAALEKAIALNPDHPGAHHYYIHMVELPKPDLAVPSAEHLENLMPAAGHLVHMPSHIFIRVGRYEDAVRANQKAILADEDYISQCYTQGMYPLGYYPHNLHFLWSAASLLGNSELAIDAAKKTAEKVPIGELGELHFLQDFASTPMLAYTRFGKWNEVLTIPYPGDDFQHLKMIWHYARGTAFLRKGNIKEAREELAALEAMKDDPALEEVIANYTNPTSQVVQVAYAVLNGELAVAEGDTEAGIASLRKGITFEDDLTYSEPAAWHIPVRQSLGAVLMKAGKYQEAEMVYREDLEKLRQNGWSLKGLQQSLEAQGKTEAAATVEKELKEAWKHADVELTGSVM